MADLELIVPEDSPEVEFARWDDRDLGARYLAVLLSTARRIEPELLRAIRLEFENEFAPARHLTVADEAALWFHPIVESRGPDAITLLPEYLHAYRAALAGDQDLLERVHRTLERLHAEGPPILAWEERLTYLLLKQPADTQAHQEELQRHLLRVHLAMSRGDRPSLDESLFDMQARLPGTAAGITSFADLARLSQQRIWQRHGGAVDVPEPGAPPVPLDPRKMPTRVLEILRGDEGDRIGDLGGQGTQAIRVPALTPVYLDVMELRNGSFQVAGPMLVVPADGEVLLKPGGRERYLRSIDGSVFHLPGLQPSSASQKFIARNRAPRVQIEYDIELYGAEKKVNLPFVIGVMADLGGKPSEGPVPLEERKFLDADMDNFEDRMRQIAPRVAFQVPNTLAGVAEIDVDLRFETMRDFDPGTVASKLFPFLLTARGELARLLTLLDGLPAARTLVNELLADPDLLRVVAEAVAPSHDDFYVTGLVPHPRRNEYMERLALVFETRSKADKDALYAAIGTLASHALQTWPPVPGGVPRDIEAVIAQLDSRLSTQVNPILHHADFRALEGSWRGLHHLVFNTEVDETLKIRILNVSKQELGEVFKTFSGEDWHDENLRPLPRHAGAVPGTISEGHRHDNPLYRKLYEEAYGAPDGEPYDCLIGDYPFDYSPADVALLGRIGRLAMEIHAPFFAAAAPSLMDLDSWQELSNPRDLSRMFASPEYQAWNVLRDSESARYLGLTLPRVLARPPYGAKTEPVDEFAFEEEIDPAQPDCHVWSNAAYAFGVNVARAFKLHGWCARIRGPESGGMVEGLPCHTFPTDDGGVDMKCPTEIAITDRREAELGRSGLIPLSHWKNTDYAVFMGAQSFRRPAGADPESSATDNMYSRLPYLFGVCRFVHYLKCMVRDKIGSFKEMDDVQRWLNHWIMDYVVDGQASESEKAARPLGAAEIVLREPAENVGEYEATLWCQPHYQLQGLTAPVRMDFRLPSVKQGMAS